MRRTPLRGGEKKTIVVDERKTLRGSFALPWGGRSSAIGNLRSISFLFPDTDIICANAREMRDTHRASLENYLLAILAFLPGLIQTLDDCCKSLTLTSYS